MNKKLRRKLRRPIEYLPIFCLYVFSRLVSLRMMRRVGKLIGFFLYQIPNTKKIVKANLYLAFPDLKSRERRKLGIQSCANLVNSFLEFLWFYKRAHRLQEFVENDIDQLKKDIQGTGQQIILTLHMGNWEMLALSKDIIGVEKLAAVARKIKNPSIENLMLKGRQATGTKIIHQEGAVKELITSIRQGFSLGLLVDQNTKVKEGGQFASLFNLPSTITRSPETLSRKFKLPVAFCICLRTKKGFRYEYHPIPQQIADIAEGEKVDFCQSIMTEMEFLIKKHPEQWLWFYKRWAIIPPDVDDNLRSRYPSYADFD